MTMRARAIVASIALALAAGTHAAGPERDPFGKLRVFEPEGPMRGFVVLYSDAHGWDDTAQSAARALAHAGALVAGVDTAQYLPRIAQASRHCGALVGDAEATSRDLQRARKYPDYRLPILAGIGTGGALAAAILQAAPPTTLAGTVAIDPRSPREALCIAPTYPPDKPLPGFYTAALHPDADRHDAGILARHGAQAIQPLPAGGDDATALTALIEPHLAPVAAPTGIARLPLIELPAAQPSPYLAIMISGDGGWRDLDKVIAEDLSRTGVSVVGWDSLRYFWTYKSPDETARDLAEVIAHYTRLWHAHRVALIGYSFGADVIPILYDTLPAAQRRDVVQLSLLGLSSAAEFEIKVTGWISTAHSAHAVPTGPALAKIPSDSLQCFYGEKEDDTQCPVLAARGVETIRTTGGHHFDGNYAALAQRILDGLKARSTHAGRAGTNPAPADTVKPER
jgi:type IV secretory pathway VirJ component